MRIVNTWVEYKDANPELLNLLEQCRQIVLNSKFECSYKFSNPAMNYRDGIKPENKQVYEIEQDGQVFCVQFHDGHIGIGAEPYNHDEISFMPITEEEWKQKSSLHTAI